MIGTVLPCGLEEEGSIFLSPRCWEAESHVLWLSGKYVLYLLFVGLGLRPGSLQPQI